MEAGHSEVYRARDPVKNIQDAQGMSLLFQHPQR